MIGLDGPESEALGAWFGDRCAQAADATVRTSADLGETGWSAEMIETFRAICSAEMDAYGYNWGASYTAPAHDQPAAPRTGTSPPPPRSHRVVPGHSRRPAPALGGP
jgi:hypothetical protein